MRKKIKNQLYLAVFCALIGAFAGAIIWGFLKTMAEGMAFIWEWVPGRVSIPYYTIIVCTVGAALIGLFRKKYGDYPEELSVVLGKVKREKRYEYKNMLVMLLAALFPLVLGSSVGPESGLAGIIVGLCYWAGDNLKFAHKNAKEYSEIGMAVTLSVLFHSPLFGIFAVEETEEEDPVFQLSRSSKLFVYGLALAAGTGIYMALSSVFGAGLSGFPSFLAVEPKGKDFLMLGVYIIAGCVLAKFYEITHHAGQVAAGKIPGILREAIGGLCLGAAGTLVPAVMFSGEEQMAELMTEYTYYLPWMLIGVAFLKVLLTNICIQMGLKGGHFFPVIFAGVCLGYGIAMCAFSESAGHVVFAAAIVTATMLGGTMKKPLAVTMLLLICFPVKMFVWILLAAAVGSKCLSIGKKGEAKRSGVKA